MKSNFISVKSLCFGDVPKKGLLAAVAGLVCLNLFGQGTVHFAGNNSTLVMNGATGSPVKASDGIKAALYWSPRGSSNFVQIGAPVNVGVPLPGVFVGGTRTTGWGSSAPSPAR